VYAHRHFPSPAQNDHNAARCARLSQLQLIPVVEHHGLLLETAAGCVMFMTVECDRVHAFTIALDDVRLQSETADLYQQGSAFSEETITCRLCVRVGVSGGGTLVVACRVLACGSGVATVCKKAISSGVVNSVDSGC
jgi:hypothetical protein